MSFDHTRFARIGTQRVGTAAGKECGVIVFGTGYPYIVPVVLQDGHIGQVLHNAVGRFGGNVFVGRLATLHADVVGHTECTSHVALFGGIYQYPSFHGLRLACVLRADYPTAFLAAGIHKGSAVLHGE